MQSVLICTMFVDMSVQIIRAFLLGFWSVVEGINRNLFQPCWPANVKR